MFLSNLIIVKHGWTRGSAPLTTCSIELIIVIFGRTTYTNSLERPDRYFSHFPIYRLYSRIGSTNQTPSRWLNTHILVYFFNQILWIYNKSEGSQKNNNHII